MKRPPAISLSPSAASRWMTCTASPRFIMENEHRIGSTDTVWNVEGDMAHAVANAVLLGQEIPKESRGKAIPKDKLPEMLKHAKGFKEFVDPTGIEIKESEKKVSLWYMPARNGYVDAIVFKNGGNTIGIVDLKYGQGVAVGAEENEQMAIYARSWAEEYISKRVPGLGLDLDTVFELAIYQPRIREGDKISIWTLTWAELKEFTDNIEHIAKKIIAGVDEKFQPSEDACRFCPMKKPAKGPPCAAYTEWTGASQAIVFSDVNPREVMTDLRQFDEQTLRRIAANRRKIINFVDDVYKAYYGEAINGKIPEGFKLVRGKGSRSWQDPEQAGEFLQMMFGHEAYTDPKLKTPKAIEDMFKAHAMKPSGLAPLIKKFEGGVLLVPVEDPRESITINPADVFQNLDVESLPSSED
jgi:hypothetical protein